MSLNIVVRPGGWRGIVWPGVGAPAAALTQRAQTCPVLQLKEQERLRSRWLCCLPFQDPKLQLGQFPRCLCFSIIFWEMVGHWREVALCVFAKIQPRWLSVEQQDIVCE